MQIPCCGGFYPSYLGPAELVKHLVQTKSVTSGGGILVSTTSVHVSTGRLLEYPGRSDQRRPIVDEGAWAGPNLGEWAAVGTTRDDETRARGSACCTARFAACSIRQTVMVHERLSISCQSTVTMLRLTRRQIPRRLVICSPIVRGNIERTKDPKERSLCALNYFNHLTLRDA